MACRAGTLVRWLMAGVRADAYGTGDAPLNAGDRIMAAMARR